MRYVSRMVEKFDKLGLGLMAGDMPTDAQQPGWGEPTGPAAS